MPKAKLQPVNLGSIARGAAMELFELEIARIAANINDRSTSATATREIVLRFKFKPDLDRHIVEVDTSSSSKIAPIANHASRAYLGRDEAGKVYVFDQDPRQEMLFEPPAEEDNNVVAFNQTA
jgi:hypothetical protein